MDGIMVIVLLSAVAALSWAARGLVQARKDIGRLADENRQLATLNRNLAGELAKAKPRVTKPRNNKPKNDKKNGNKDKSVQELQP